MEPASPRSRLEIKTAAPGAVGRMPGGRRARGFAGKRGALPGSSHLNAPAHSHPPGPGCC